MSMKNNQQRTASLEIYLCVSLTPTQRKRNVSWNTSYLRNACSIFFFTYAHCLSRRVTPVSGLPSPPESDLP